MYDTPISRDRYDVIVVGARCAGAATARLLARSGARVLAIDRSPYGSDALSTHALMRAGVALLDRWGVLRELIAAGTPAVRRTEFGYGEETVAVDIKPAHGVDALYAPRRALLDRLLVDAAVSAGAEIRHKVLFQELIRAGDGGVTGIRLRQADGAIREIRADLVIGADGRQSAVAEQAGAQTTSLSRHQTASVFGYFGGIENVGYRWLYRPGVNVGVIPTNDGEHCVFVGTSPERLREICAEDAEAGFLSEVAACDPGLAERLAPQMQTVRLRRFLGAPGHMRRAHGRGWALVGDAGYFKDPVTAHGITDALRDAELLSRAVLSGAPDALAAYQQQRDALSRELFQVTDAIASLDWDMDALKALHGRLNKAMKVEAAHVLGEEAEAIAA